MLLTGCDSHIIAYVIFVSGPKWLTFNLSSEHVDLFKACSTSLKKEDSVPYCAERFVPIRLKVVINNKRRKNILHRTFRKFGV